MIRRSHLLHFSSDAPILVQIIDTEENIKRLIPALDEMVAEGLIACPMLKSSSTCTRKDSGHTVMPNPKIDSDFGMSNGRKSRDQQF